MSECRVLVMFATAEEMQGVDLDLRGGAVVCEVCGVGSTLAAYNTLKMIELHSPKYVILAGIAGMYSGSTGLATGDVVVVGSELNGDLGSFSSGGFEAKFAQTLEAKPMSGVLGEAVSHLPKVDSMSLNSAASPFVSSANCSIENMEGWGFFLACEGADAEYIELRAISNIVGDPFERWSISQALNNLSRELKDIISKLCN